MVWNVMAWYVMTPYGMVWYGMVWYGMVWYGMVWYAIVRHGCQYGMLVWHDAIVWHAMAWYGKERYGTVWYGVVRFVMARYRMVLYGTVWHENVHGTVRYGTECVLLALRRFLAIYPSTSTTRRRYSVRADSLSYSRDTSSVVTKTTTQKLHRNVIHMSKKDA